MNSKLLFYFFIVLSVQFNSCSNNPEEVQIPKEPICEQIEWLDIWMPEMNKDSHPRVLLIGNSITKGYYKEVSKLLQDKAYIARLTTSKSLGNPVLLEEIELVLSQKKFDVVHFNNGLHGGGYTEKEYREGFLELISTLKKRCPNAQLIWASTTPVRSGSGMRDFDPFTERVKERNFIALECIAEQDIVVNDLFGLIENHPEYYADGDGIHLVHDGTIALARQVAHIIEEVIVKDSLQ